MELKLKERQDNTNLGLPERWSYPLWKGDSRFSSKKIIEQEETADTSPDNDVVRDYQKIFLAKGCGATIGVSFVKISKDFGYDADWPSNRTFSGGPFSPFSDVSELEYHRLIPVLCESAIRVPMGKVTPWLSALQRIKYHLPLTLEASEYCAVNNLYSVVETAYSLILWNFKKVKQILINLSYDPEIQNYKKLCFSLKTTDSPQNILLSERSYYRQFFERVPKEDQGHIVLTYEVVSDDESS